MKYLIVFVLLWLAVVPACAATDADLIHAADTAFSREHGFSLTAYRGDLEKALALYAQALPLIPRDALQTRAYVLDRLGEGYFELGTAYLTNRDEQEQAFRKGKDYSLKSLRLEPQFAAQEKESFRAALSQATDVRAIFWYGNNLGRYLNFHPLAALSGGMKDVVAAFERAIELDETYLAGGPWRALGSFLAQVPGFLGGDRKKAADAYARAIAIGPDFLENYVDDAEYVAKANKNWSRFCAELRTVLEKSKDQDVMAAWPLYNALAVNRAQALLSGGHCE